MTDKARQEQQNWIIEQKGFDASEADFYDSLFFQGNGYAGVRGFQDEFNTCDDYLRTTFMNGVYDYIKKDISDMVNTPNFFAVKIGTIGTAEEVSPVIAANSIQGTYSRSLNLHNGVLSKKYQTRSEQGTIEIQMDRFLSLSDTHLAVQRLSVDSVDFEGDIDLIFSIDGGVRNNTIHDEQLKKEMNPVSLLEPVLFEKHAGYLLMAEKTLYSGITLAEALRVEVSPDTHAAEMEPLIDEDSRMISYHIRIRLAPGEHAELIKKVCIYSSRDPEGWADPVQECRSKISLAAGSWDALYAGHAAAWQQRWADSDIRIEGDDRSQLEVRFAIYNLIVNYSVNDPRCSIGARGLTHGRYKGCYFWDTEIYMLPFYTLTHPQSAKNLLLYRYNTLDAARSEAKRFNLSGARYSWMCTPDGKEQCETWDTGASEIHITADVAYAIDQYWKITGDDDFAARYGLEMMIEICRYWVSRFSYDARTNLYNLLWVKGPNEYGGVTVNNSFTVSMAVYGFESCRKMLQSVRKKDPEQYKAVAEITNFVEDEILTWNQISLHVHISIDSKKNLLLEDDLFMLSEPVDAASLKIGDQPLYKTICFDRLQRMRVLKQADVLLLMGLLPEQYTDVQKKAAWEFYEPITMHDSTLSFGTHGWVGAMFGFDEKAFAYFQKSAGIDTRNLMGNTADEGLHLAAFGGTWMTAVFGFAGLSLRGEDIRLNPHLPKTWESLSFPFIHKGKRYICRVDHSGSSIETVLQKEA